MANSIEKMIEVEETAKRLKTVEEALTDVRSQQSKILALLENLKKKI